MAICNRDHGISEQRDAYMSSVVNVGTGVTALVSGPIPYPCELQAVQLAATGLSGSAEWTLSILRFAASGETTIPVGLSSLIMQDFAVSGALGYSLFATGSSQVQMLQGDCLKIETTGANTAVGSAELTFIVRKLQDIVSSFNLPT